MKMLRQLLVMSLLSLTIFQIGIAQNTQKISIQGIVKNGNGGAIPDGDLSITFTLYDSVKAGNVVWSETQPAVTVTGGVYSALLGTFMDFSAVSFDEPYFLGVKVGSDVELTPRTEMTYAPYALAVDKIKSSVGTGNSFSSTGNVGIGTNAPDTKLKVVDGTENALTLKTPDNLLNNGIAFQNSGTAYTWNIKRDDDGGNQADLVISGGTANVDVTALPERLRIKQSDGTIDIAENVDIGGTIQIRGGNPGVGDVLTATGTDGSATWQSEGTSVVWVNNQSGFDSFTEVQMEAFANNATKINVSIGTSALSVVTGNVISVNGSFQHRFANVGAGGQDNLDYGLQVAASNECTTANVGTMSGLSSLKGEIRPNAIGLTHSRDFLTYNLQGAFIANCTGDLTFSIYAIHLPNPGATGYDAHDFSKGPLVVRKN